MGERYTREEELGTSWTSVIFGWIAALGASLILSSIIGLVVSAIFATLGFRGGTEAGTTSLVGAFDHLFSVLSCRRLRRRTHGEPLRHQARPLSGPAGTDSHGNTGALGSGHSDPLVNIPGVTFSNVPTTLPEEIPGLGIVLSVWGLLVLVFMFAGGAIGGQWGAKTGRRRP